MKRTVCDVCGVPATATYNIKRLPTGNRPILLFSSPEMPGKYLDLCDEHDGIRHLLKVEKV